MKFSSESLALNYVEEQIKKFARYSSYSTSGKRYAYERAIEVVREYHLESFFEIDCRQYFYEDRIIRARNCCVHMREQAKPIPHCGCYLLGNTAFNPYTEEKFYWVKVGMSSDMERRMKSYSTHTPTVFKIDFIEVPSQDVYWKEYKCHCVLEDIGEQAKDSKEWYRVNEKDYLEICSKGFHYFEK